MLHLVGLIRSIRVCRKYIRNENNLALIDSEAYSVKLQLANNVNI